MILMILTKKVATIKSKYNGRLWKVHKEKGTFNCPGLFSWLTGKDMKNIKLKV